MGKSVQPFEAANRVKGTNEMTSSPDPNQTQSSALAGPTMAVNHFALVVTANEFLIPVGQSRVIMNVINNQPDPQQVAEWVATLSCSPSAVKVLYAQLGQALQHYESTFGTIPQDPALELKAGIRNP